MYYTYMLRCEDNSIYTGITIDLERRLKEHLEQKGKGAKYTKRHKAKKMDAAWKSKDRVLASRLESALKTLKKEEKEKLIAKESKLSDFFEVRLECKKYRRIKLEE